MVIDVVLYNGEKEMFDLRYEILKDQVDLFVVMEFDTTFSGKPKSYSFLGNRPKLKHYRLTQEHLKDIEVPAEMYPNFAIEYAQREAMKLYFQESPTLPNTLIYVGDVDEIWKPGRVGEGVHKLEQVMYYYFLNNRWYRNWAGTFVGRWKDIKDISWNTTRQGPGQRMDNPATFPNLIKDGGWHFTNCMLLTEIKRKIESYSHQEYNTQSFLEDLPYKMVSNIDYYGNSFSEKIDEESWPQYLKDNKEKYIHICKKS